MICRKDGGFSLNQEPSMPIKVKPYEHQVKAFLFALQVMGFISD